MNLSKWIKTYTGVGDVGTWIKKFKMVAKHQKIKDMASVLPLLLEDSVFLVYDNLSEKSQASRLSQSIPSKHTRTLDHAIRKMNL